MVAAPKAVRGVQFAPSMAAGALLVAPLVTAILTRAGGGTPFTQASPSSPQAEAGGLSPAQLPSAEQQRPAHSAQDRGRPGQPAWVNTCWGGS